MTTSSSELSSSDISIYIYIYIYQWYTSSDIQVESCPISVDSMDQQNCSSETVLIGLQLALLVFSRNSIFQYFSIEFFWNRNLHARLSSSGGLCEAISRHLRQDLRLTGTSDLITLRDVHNFQDFLRTCCSQSHSWLNHECEFNWEHPHDTCSVSHHFVHLHQCISADVCRCSKRVCFEVYNTSECDNLGSVSSGSYEDTKMHEWCTSCLRLRAGQFCVLCGAWFCVLFIHMCIRASFLTYDFYQFMSCVILQSHYVPFVNSSFTDHWCFFMWFFMCCIFLLRAVALASDLMTSLQRRCQTNYEGTATGGSTSNQRHFLGGNSAASVKGG